MTETFNGGGPIGTCNNGIAYYRKRLDEAGASEQKLLTDLETIKASREFLSQMLDQWTAARDLLVQQQEADRRNTGPTATGSGS